MFWERQISIPRSLLSQKSKFPWREKVWHSLFQGLRVNQFKTPSTKTSPK